VILVFLPVLLLFIILEIFLCRSIDWFCQPHCVLRCSPPANDNFDAGSDSGDLIVTLLFTNDVESAYDPISAFWLDDVDMIGGIAEMTYDLDKPKYSRVVTLHHNGKPVADDDLFTLAAPGFLTEGGDFYDSFPESQVIGSVGKVSDVIIQYFRNREMVAVPERDRQWPVQED
jgi:hypothetical protein